MNGRAIFSFHGGIVPHPAESDQCYWVPLFVGPDKAAGRVMRSAGTIFLVRAIATRVASASVTVNDDVVGQIGAGLLVLVGVTHTDTAETARALAGKLHELRILTGDESCATIGAPLLVVSQFTLYARTDKGRRPSWNLAAPGDRAEPLVVELIEELRRRGATVETGVFGAMMQVASVNDGPFTVTVELPATSS